MGSDEAKVAKALPDSCNIKVAVSFLSNGKIWPIRTSLGEMLAEVHRLMCAELSKFVDRILEIFPAIESAQPRCTTGIDALCSLNITMEKAKLLIQHCTECSKLYLAITGDAILRRCERIRNALEQSLSQIQNMVPLLLAAQISGIVDDLKDAKFIMESSEEEAGKVVLSLLCQASDSAEASEFEAFQIAALSLHITSQKSLLIEKRSIKKLLDKVRNTDQRKEKILNYLLYLLSKYGKLIRDEQTRDASVSEDSRPSTSYAWNKAALDQSLEPESDVRFTQSKGRPDVSSKPIPPEEFTCPISLRLMHDPVVIASGQTFERVWIQKWFSEGNDTCPKTQKMLSHFSVTPNSAIKDLISKWCGRHAINIPDPCSHPIPSALYSWKSSSSSSIASFDNSLNDVPTRYDISNVSFGSSDASCVSDLSHSKVVDNLCLGLPQANDDYHRYQSSADFIHVMKSGFSNLASLPWESQCNAVRDAKNYLEDDRQAYHSMQSDNFAESLIIFLKDAYDRNDVQAQQVGAQVLLTFVKRSRSEIPSLCEDVFHLMASFLDSKIAEEALAIMDILSADECCTPKHVASGFFSSIRKIIDSEVKELHAPAVKILHNLSLYNNINSHILHMEFIQKLVSFLSDNSLAEYCLKVLKYLCNTEEGRIAVVEANDSIAAIAELLETGTHKQQEHAVAVLLSLCSNHFENCQLVLKEGVIPPLVDISVNGDTKGKEIAMELLQLLRDIRHTDSLDSSLPSAGSILKLPWDSSFHSSEKQSSPKASGFFGRKFRIFTKPSSLALF